MHKNLFYKRLDRLLRGPKGYQRLLQGNEGLPAGKITDNFIFCFFNFSALITKDMLIDLKRYANKRLLFYDHNQFVTFKITSDDIVFMTFRTTVFKFKRKLMTPY